jgi:muramoyltetrapeptide carboxypeptidase
MEYIHPKALKKGDTIGLIAPSSPLQPGRIETGTCYLEQKGFKVKLGKHLKNADRFLAGKDEDRASDVMDFFLDPEVHAIMATAGGHGSIRLLPLLNYDIIHTHPKILTGFSNTTALQLALLKNAGLVSYSGFTLRDTDEFPINPLIDETLIACFSQQSYAITEGKTVNPGMVEGPLIGGTLSLIASLMGTPFQPSFKNHILFFEEVWFEPFLVDSMLSQLQLAGVFDEIIGVIIGQFESCVAKIYPERDGTIDDVINEWSSRIKVPCLKDFPYGHGNRRCVLPIGKKVILDASNRYVKIP